MRVDKLFWMLIFVVAAAAGFVQIKKEPATYYSTYAPSVVRLDCIKYHQKHRRVKKMGHGSGVIINSRGWILTAAHVANVSEIFIAELEDGRVFYVTPLYSNTKRDIAIMIPCRPLNAKLPAIKIAKKVVIGSEAYHIGNPGGLHWVITNGLVSTWLENYIVSTSIVGPGSSGGPLLNGDGELIGITSGALVAGFGWPTGFNYFVPLNAIHEILDGWNAIK